MRWIKAVAAGLMLGALVVLPPAGLIVFIGNPWPEGGIMWSAALSDSAVIGILAVVVWVLWAQFVLCVLAEVTAAFRQRDRAVGVPLAFGFQQQLARRLVTAVLAVGVATPVLGFTGAAIAAEPAPMPGPQSSMLVSHTEEEVEVAAPTTLAAAAQETRTVVVGHLDNLYTIAQTHLGAGNRWPEIARLNQGLEMKDGTTFTNPEVIHAGWELRVPTADEPSSPQEAGTHTVAKGEYLSKIAQDRLGDGNRWPELYDANREVIDDPNLIHPGQVLAVPGDTPARGTVATDKVGLDTPDVAERAESNDAAALGAVPSTEPPVAAPQADPSTEFLTQIVDAGEKPSLAGTTTSDSVSLDENEGTVWPVRTVGGVGAFLAAGVIALIALRRGRQRRQRKPGERMPLPSSPAAAEVEQELRVVADDQAVDNVDVALRALAAACDQDGEPRPRVRLARVTASQIDLYLSAAATLPAPWRATDESTVWFLPTTDAAQIPDLAAEVAAPWPGLVTVGHDGEDGLLLLNLEEVGTFGVVGAAQALNVFAAIAIELGTASWSQDVSLTIVGALEELGELLEPGRVRYVPSARKLAPESGAALEVVLDGARSLTREECSALRNRGVVVVTHGWSAGDTGLQITGPDQARLLPYNLEVTPQLVDDRTFEGLREILQASLLEPVASQSREPVVPFDADDVLDDVVPDASTEDQEEADATALDPAEEPAIDATSVGTEAGSLEAAVVSAALPAEELEATLHEFLQTGHPVIRLLGEVVDIVGTTAPAPASETHQKVCTRIAAYLALNPNTSRQSLNQAVWGGQRISPSTVDSRISNLRAWLGENPDTQEKYLPPRSLRFTDAVTTDWGIFTKLIGSNPTTAATTALEEALSLVRGRPLEGEESKHYGFAEYVVAEMMDTIVDAAYELARRRYFEGSWRKAGQAAALGVLLEPGNERLWRLRIHAAHSAGNSAEVSEAVARMHARITELGFELEDETTALLQALAQQDAETISLSRQAL
ncbi:LysM peptidoglycan-binding domain-containing protein [Nocardioides limicola]|uniref:LysM peptidoglycan-binding domain-containing protein n=1 Tax=Nocardioides limicola TaxID=2803368 RepID=UPI00193C0CD3|nr:LysM peptidoglycan-binding domain-containing protein [Nocardioides sp. DJM-14]